MMKKAMLVPQKSNPKIYLGHIWCCNLKLHFSSHKANYCHQVLLNYINNGKSVLVLLPK